MGSRVSECDTSSTSDDGAPRPSKIRKLDSLETQTKAYGKKYLIAKNGEMYQCLVCHRQFKQCTDTNFRQHYNIFHSYEFGKYEGSERKDLLHSLKCGLQREQLHNDEEEDFLRASYKICLRIAKEHRPFEDGEFLKSSNLLFSSVGDTDTYNKVKEVGLSPTTIAHRIFELSANIKQQLHTRVKRNIAYSLAFAVTKFADTEVVGIFIRYLNENFEVAEYLLEMVLIKDTTTSKDIFYALSEAIDDSGLSWANLFSISYPYYTFEMISPASALFQLIKGQVRKAGAMHSIIIIPSLLHLGYLYSNQPWLKCVADGLLRILYNIRTLGQDQPQFRNLIRNLESRFKDYIPLDSTKVNWLMMSAIIKGFLPLIDEVKLFLETQRNIESVLNSEWWLLNCAFLGDLSHHLQNLNTSLKNRNNSIIQFLNQTSAFKSKISLWMNQLRSHNFSHFANTEYIINKASIKKEAINTIIFVERLKQIQSHLEKQIRIGVGVIKKLNIFSSPYNVLPIEVEKMYQLEIIELQSDDVMRGKFRLCGHNLIGFYKDLPRSTYPRLHNLAAQVLSMFCTTFTVDRLHSCVKKCMKSSPMITDMHLRSTLRIMTTPTSIVPDINALVSEKKGQVENSV